MNDCPLHLDADVLSRALGGDLDDADADRVRTHVPDCATCAATARAMGRARSAWRAAIDDDDRAAAMAREARLAAVGRRDRREGREGRDRDRPRSFARAVLAFAAFATFASIAVAIHLRATPSFPGRAGTDAAAGLVVTRGCTGCTDAVAVAVEMGAGAPLVAGSDTDISAGGSVVLAWTRGDGTIAPGAEVRVEGPARLRAITDEGRTVVVLARGVAFAKARATTGEIRSEYVVTSGAYAAWRMEATAGGTRVEAISGEVRVASVADPAAVRLLRAGEALDVDAPSAPPPVAPPSPPPTGAARTGTGTPSTLAAPPRATNGTDGTAGTDAAAGTAAAAADDAWRAARDQLARGDRAGARRALAALAGAPSTPTSLRERTRFTLAELEIADGDVDAARADLASLFTAADPSLAADAAFLIARTSAPGTARAEAWARYLATSPPSPQREEAEIERATALVDAGDVAAARPLAADAAAHRDALTGPARAALVRLERRLGDAR